MENLGKKLASTKTKYAYWNDSHHNKDRNSECSECSSSSGDGCHGDGECGGDGE